MHLYYNMASFLLKGVSLELMMGSQAFAVLLAFSLVTSQVLMLLSSWLLLTVFDMPGPMQTCTVGFSGVLFALKYVLSRRSPGVVSVSVARRRIRIVRRFGDCRLFYFRPSFVADPAAFLSSKHLRSPAGAWVPSSHPVRSLAGARADFIHGAQRIVSGAPLRDLGGSFVR